LHELSYYLLNFFVFINPVTNDIVVNESDKANVLNNYVCSISSTANNIDPPNLPRRTPFSLDDDINDDDLKDILKSLQIGKASGGDFIRNLCSSI
jgi:hypothetical protein